MIVRVVLHSRLRSYSWTTSEYGSPRARARAQVEMHHTYSLRHMRVLVVLVRFVHRQGQAHDLGHRRSGEISLISSCILSYVNTTALFDSIRSCTYVCVFVVDDSLIQYSDTLADRTITGGADAAVIVYDISRKVLLRPGPVGSSVASSHSSSLALTRRNHSKTCPIG